MSVSRDDVDRMAQLARLDLEGDEAESLMHDLNGILDHVDTLNEVDAGGVGDDAPSYREGGAPMRDDGAEEADPLQSPPREMAPEWKEGFFSVPRLPGLEGGDGPEGGDE